MLDYNIEKCYYMKFLKFVRKIAKYKDISGKIVD